MKILCVSAKVETVVPGRRTARRSTRKTVPDRPILVLLLFALIVANCFASLHIRGRNTLLMPRSKDPHVYLCSMWRRWDRDCRIQILLVRDETNAEEVPWEGKWTQSPINFLLFGPPIQSKETFAEKQRSDWKSTPKDLPEKEFHTNLVVKLIKFHERMYVQRLRCAVLQIWNVPLLKIFSRSPCGESLAEIHFRKD